MENAKRSIPENEREHFIERDRLMKNAQAKQAWKYTGVIQQPHSFLRINSRITILPVFQPVTPELPHSSFAISTSYAEGPKNVNYILNFLEIYIIKKWLLTLYTYVYILIIILTNIFNDKKT